MSRQECNLRSAGFADAERIFSLIQRHSDALVPRSMGDIVQNADRFVVAESGGEIVGCASYAIHPEIGVPENATVEVTSVAVDKSLRRTGIGGALVKEIVRRVSSLRPKEVLALTFAPEFFASLGFEEIPKTEVMHKLYTGCINCTKHANPFTCPEKAMALKVRGEPAR